MVDYEDGTLLLIFADSQEWSDALLEVMMSINGRRCVRAIPVVMKKAT